MQLLGASGYTQDIYFKNKFISDKPELKMQPKFLHDVFFTQSQKTRSKFQVKAKHWRTANFSKLRMPSEQELVFWQDAKGLLSIIADI